MSELVPEVKLTLDKERSLRYDLNAMVKFQEATGKNLLKPGILKEIIRLEEGHVEVDPKDLRALLWCGLLHECPALTLEDAGKLAGMLNIAPLTTLMIQAYVGAMPAESAEPGENKSPLP